jgi:hypothetical protein
MIQASVIVHPDHRGGWEVSVSDRPAGIKCDTLEEAQRVAWHVAERRQPCDLVVHDAYERVLRHELIDPQTADESTV